jgi:hypothetical protein
MTMIQLDSLAHEIAVHMTTTPIAALAPLLWAAGLMVVLRRAMRRSVPRRGHEVPAATPVTDDLRSAA